MYLVICRKKCNFAAQMAKHLNKTSKPTAVPKAPLGEKKPKDKRRAVLLPVIVVMFILVWLWAWLWYGDVFCIARECSFWAPDQTLMQYLVGRPWEPMLWIGQAALMLFRWPVVGALLMALLMSVGTWLVGYCLRLRGWWRLLQFILAAAYLFTIAYLGFDIYFEAETGLILGIPLLAVLVLIVTAFIIRSFSHGHKFPSIIHPPKDETPRQNYAQILTVIGIVLLTMGITQVMRPYVRVVTKMQCQMMEQDWRGMAETARANADLSYRHIAAYYAIALVHTGEQGSHLFDIRLDYDEPYIHGYNNNSANAANYYIPDCDLAAGLVQTATHHAIERMTMCGPSLQNLKLLTKCALLKGEWKVAEKYLHILSRVPFEGSFVEKYSPMVCHTELVDNDPEFKNVRLTEPVRDNFENFFIQPTFLGYNAALMEGRSINALWNSLMVHIYTKTMPQFIERCQPLQGTTPPQQIAEALTLMSGKNPALLQAFPTLEYNRPRLMTFLQETKPFLTNYDMRKAHARELFPKWKGYYPYYYFFGNLKATRGHTKENEGSSNQGVN